MKRLNVLPPARDVSLEGFHNRLDVLRQRLGIHVGGAALDDAARPGANVEMRAPPRPVQLRFPRALRAELNRYRLLLPPAGRDSSWFWRFILL